MVSSPSPPRPVTIDDLMRVRAMSDVRISPDGERVAYVVSEASFERNAYEPAIFVVSSSSGPEPVKLTSSTRIFNRPLPAARLKWTPDGKALSFLAWVGERPQVMTLPIAGGEPKQMTSAPEGVSTYEWAPDGRTIAYLSVQSMSEEEERRRKDQTFVIQVDRQNRPPRLWLQALDGGAPRAMTPLDHFVDGVSWMPDGRSLVYSAAPFSGFMAPYRPLCTPLREREERRGFSSSARGSTTRLRSHPMGATSRSSRPAAADCSRRRADSRSSRSTARRRAHRGC